jgi:hypothetical protein
MGDLLLRLGVIGAVLVGTSLTACSSSPVKPASSGQVWHVGSAQAAGPKLTVTVRGGCPATVGTATDVARSALPGSQELLPTDGEPASALICEYAEPAGALPGASTASAPGPRLTHRIALTQAQTRQLAAAISKISLVPPTGTFNCPARGVGDDTVIAFAYPAAQTVDLWYKTSGCRTLDNGDVAAFQGANPSFYSGFQTAFRSMAPD